MKLTQEHIDYIHKHHDKDLIRICHDFRVHFNLTEKQASALIIEWIEN